MTCRRQLGQAEVEDLCRASIRDEYVRRFDIPMDDPFRVRGIEAIGDLDRQIKNLVRAGRLS